MIAAEKRQMISVEDYLAGELVSPIKHEYLGGYVYAMAGARLGHNTIGGNVFATLRTRLRGRRCRPFNSDSKVRIDLPKQVRFYYPDVSVTCSQVSPNDSFHDRPVVVFEVLSQGTRRIDQGEKKDAYLTIPSLVVYVLVEQSKPEVVVHRRTDAGFVCEVYKGLDAVVPLPEIETELPLAEVFEDVEFSPEPEDED